MAKLFTVFLVAKMVLYYATSLCFAWTTRPDFYVAESRIYCDAKKDLLSCAKYRALEYIANYTDSSIIADTSLGPLRLIRVDQEDVDEEQSMFEETPRYLSADGEFNKFFKFVQRQINHFVNRQGIAISLPPGVRLMDTGVDYKAGAVEGRGKKQKATLFLQLITLFMAFKIKVLLSIALLGILVIKKVLLVGAFLLPSIIHNIKMNCKAAAIAAKSHYHYEEHPPEDVHPYSGAFGDLAGYGTGYGSAEVGHYGGFDKGHTSFHRRH